jgi:hypothetical protein
LHPTFFLASLRIKAPILLRAFPILNSLLPLKIKEAQSATKMHIRRLAIGLARDAIDAARSELAQADAYDGPGGEHQKGVSNSKVDGSMTGAGVRSPRRKRSRENLLSDLGE